MSLRRFYKKITPGYEVIDEKEWLNKGMIEIYLKQLPDFEKRCARCSHKLNDAKTGEHFMKIRTMDIHGFKAFFCFKRSKHYCPHCRKVRSVKLDFISEESPHVTEEYAWWLGRLCEISTIKDAANFSNNSTMTMWRFDFNRMKKMFQHYKIPKVSRICVDEVYARRNRYKQEKRDNSFFTIVCDLDTRRVIWVSESRSQKALDEFFKIIGPERCEEIKVIATDQHNAYRASAREYCPNATVVWDRFHIMQGFENALNESRELLNSRMPRGENKRLTRGKYKNLFLKRADRRNKIEQRHIKDVLKDNREFVYLELIKEGMFQIYQSSNQWEAREKFVEHRELKMIKCLLSVK